MEYNSSLKTLCNYQDNRVLVDLKTKSALAGIMCSHLTVCFHKERVLKEFNRETSFTKFYVT